MLDAELFVQIKRRSNYIARIFMKTHSVDFSRIMKTTINHHLFDFLLSHNSPDYLKRAY